ncbi:MAG TPA: hypothetical protein VFZ32_06580 [Micromonosporaceae bacterium]
MSGVLTLKANEPPATWPPPTRFAPPDPYPLRSFLFCATCDQPFFPSPQPDGSRAYRSRCGCRLHPLDAGQTERRVYTEALRRAFGPTAIATTSDCLAAIAARLFARVSLGPTPDDIAFIPRI